MGLQVLNWLIGMGVQQRLTCFFIFIIFFISFSALSTKNLGNWTEIEDMAPGIAGVNINKIWDNSWGGSNEDRGQGIWVNGSNMYTCGYTTSMGNGLQDMVLVKWDEDGNKIWNRTWGGSWNDEASGIGGNSTHIFTCGTYSPTQLESVLVLVAWDGAGNVEWYRTYGPDRIDGVDIFVNGSDIYTCGGKYDLSGKKDEILLIKWDMAGNIQWDRTWGGSDVEVVRGMYVNGSAIYTCGDTRSFGNGNYDSVLVKWDAAGNVVWNKTWGGEDIDLGLDVCVNGSSIYTVGAARSFSVGSDDVCLIKWDAAGNIIWNRSWGGTGSDECFSICSVGPEVYTFGVSRTVDAMGNYLLTIWDKDGNLINATDWGVLGVTELGSDIIMNTSFLFGCGWAGFNNDLTILKLAPQKIFDPPLITLYSPVQGNWYVPGQNILCNVTDRSGMGLATVKYVLSTNTTPPDWMTQGNPWSSEPYSTTIPVGIVGFVYLHVNATDNAGLSTATYFMFRRDGENPSIGLNNPSEGGSYAPETMIDCSVSDGSGIGLATVLYNWSTSVTPPDWPTDGVLWSSPYNVQVPYGPSGLLYLHVNATDLLNNQNCTTFSFLRDGASPIITLDNATENSWYAPATVIDCRVTPQGGGSITSMKYSWTTTTSPVNWELEGTLWSEPYHALMPLGTTGFLYLHINATDSFGNNRSSYFAFRRDGEAPLILLNNPPENTLLTSNITVDCSITDGVGSGVALVKFLWSSSPNPPNWNSVGSEWLGEYNTTAPAGFTGQVFLHVYAIDAVGNAHSTSFSFNAGGSEIAGFPLLVFICSNLIGVALIAFFRLRKNS